MTTNTINDQVTTLGVVIEVLGQVKENLAYETLGDPTKDKDPNSTKENSVKFISPDEQFDLQNRHVE